MDDRVARLIADHVAGKLSDADGRELVRIAVHDAEVRAAVHQQELTHRLLQARAATSKNIATIIAALPREPTSQRVLERLPRRRRRMRHSFQRWIAIAAAALVLIAVGWWNLQGSAPSSSWRVVALTGEAHRGLDGDLRPLRLKDDLATGQTLHLSTAGTVRLRGNDGSMLDFDDASRVTIVPSGTFERRLALKQGRVQALIVTQRIGERFILQTPQVEIAVIGTRFTVTVTDTATTVVVDEGIVAVQTAEGPIEQLVAGKSNRWPKSDQPTRDPLDSTRLVVVRADADADADASQPSTSFGQTPGLRLQGGDKRRVSLLRFTVPQGQIVAAELVLHRTGGAADIQVYRQESLGGWQENDLRWHHVPAKGSRIGTLNEQGGAWRCDVTDLQSGTVEFYLEVPAGTTSLGSREMPGREPTLRLRVSN